MRSDSATVDYPAFFVEQVETIWQRTVALGNLVANFIEDDGHGKPDRIDHRLGNRCPFVGIGGLIEIDTGFSVIFACPTVAWMGFAPVDAYKLEPILEFLVYFSQPPGLTAKGASRIGAEGNCQRFAPHLR